MFARLFGTVVLVLLAGVNAGSAQDPTKVESTHYKLGFENETVQVVYIHYGPHEKSSMHQHPAGVVVNLTDGHLKFSDQNGKVQEVRAIHGEARWFPAFKHKVENLSNTSYDGIYVGIKGNASSAAADPKGMPTAMDNATRQALLTFLRARESASR